MNQNTFFIVFQSEQPFPGHSAVTSFTELQLTKNFNAVDVIQSKRINLFTTKETTPFIVYFTIADYELRFDHKIMENCVN